LLSEKYAISLADIRAEHIIRIKMIRLAVTMPDDDTELASVRPTVTEPLSKVIIV
jgi:hypothetical protein